MTHSLNYAERSDTPDDLVARKIFSKLDEKKGYIEKTSDEGIYILSQVHGSKDKFSLSFVSIDGEREKAFTVFFNNDLNIEHQKEGATLNLNRASLIAIIRTMIDGSVQTKEHKSQKIVSLDIVRTRNQYALWASQNK